MSSGASTNFLLLHSAYRASLQMPATVCDLKTTLNVERCLFSLQLEAVQQPGLMQSLYRRLSIST